MGSRGGGQFILYRPGQDGSPGQRARKGIRGSGDWPDTGYRRGGGSRTPDFRDVADTSPRTLHGTPGRGGRSPHRVDATAPAPTYRSAWGCAGTGVGDRIVVQRARPIVAGTRRHTRTGASGPGGWLWAHSQEEPPGFVRCRTGPRRRHHAQAVSLLRGHAPGPGRAAHTAGSRHGQSRQEPGGPDCSGRHAPT